MVKPSYGTFSLFFLALFAATMTVLSCDDSDEVESPHSYQIGLIEWPQKMMDESSVDWLEVDATVLTPEDVYCWSTVSWRPSFTAAEVAPYDSQQSWIDTNQTVGFAFDYGGHGKQALGVYTLRVGLTANSANVYDPLASDETAMYNHYVGSAFYMHDVEFEYIYQSDGFDEYDIFRHNNLDDMAEPYRDTRVTFVKHEFVMTPPPPEDVPLTFPLMLDYNNRFATVWPANTAQKKCRYVLLSIRHLLNPDGSLSDAFGVAAAGSDDEFAFVACGRIAELIGCYREQVEMKVASHEMGHLIGQGLTDYCLCQSSHTDSTCVMSYFTIDTQKTPWWGCNGAMWLPFDGNLHFCSACREHLSNVEFLMSDYRSHYAGSSDGAAERVVSKEENL